MVWRYLGLRVCIPLSGRKSNALSSGRSDGRALTFWRSSWSNFAVANAPAGTEPQKIVNWDVAAQKLRSSITIVQEEAREVRKDVHEATR